MTNDPLKDHQRFYDFLHAVGSMPEWAESQLREEPGLAQLRNAHGETPLHYCVLKADPAGAALVQAHGADVNSRNDDGDTPLLCAAALGDVTLSRLLLDWGADPNARNAQEEGALHRAAWGVSGPATLIELLIAAGAAIDICDALHQTPLHLTVSRAQLPATRCLLEAGADPNLCDDCARTPLLARANHLPSLELITLLAAHGADLARPDPSGRTLLHYAAAQGRPDLVALLLEAGLVPDRADAAGQTPLDAARLAARKWHHATGAPQRLRLDAVIDLFTR